MVASVRVAGAFCLLFLALQPASALAAASTGAPVELAACIRLRAIDSDASAADIARFNNCAEQRRLANNAPKPSPDALVTASSARPIGMSALGFVAMQAVAATECLGLPAIDVDATAADIERVNACSNRRQVTRAALTVPASRAVIVVRSPPPQAARHVASHADARKTSVHVQAHMRKTSTIADSDRRRTRKLGGGAATPKRRRS